MPMSTTMTASAGVERRGRAAVPPSRAKGSRVAWA